MERIEEIKTIEFSKRNYEFFSIVGDLGSQNSYLAICGIKNKKLFEIILRHNLKSSDMENIPEKINEILKDAKENYDIEVNRCCIAGAGPVSRRRGYIKLTNVDLEINSHEIKQKTLLNKVILVNDFEALGYGLDFIDFEKELIPLTDSDTSYQKNWTNENVYSILGSGIGLGVSIAYYDSKKHLHNPLPSEGGHIEFSPRNDFDFLLKKYIQSKVIGTENQPVEYERILSSSGLGKIFDFVVETDLKEIAGISKEDQESEIVSKITSLSGTEKQQMIEQNYHNDGCCKTTIDKFIEYLARFSRTIALVSECYSGLFIYGKVVIKNLELFKDGRFLQEFKNHEKKLDVLDKIPVYLIQKDDLGLIGCCNVATNFYNLM